MSQRIIKKHDVELCTESFGNPQDPSILLIMGATASMIWWDEEFCQRLSNHHRFVIRYDNRDVGCSTCYEPGNPRYTVVDMADDALSILDGYGITRAHLVGMSLGGMIAQIIAMRHPERVLSVTAIASGIWDDLPELPQIDQKILDYHQKASLLDWNDQKAVIEYIVGGWRMLNGSAHPFDEKRTLRLAEAEIKRAKNLLCMFNHSLLKGGEELYGQASSIKVPFLIIHGTEDPVLPFVHAEVMHKTIEHSVLLRLEGSGHEIHYDEWDKVITAIVNHTEQQ